MKYRKLGRTGVKVSELIFGCGRGGGIMIDADEETQGRAVTRALDAGINWFDTAAMYGQGKSETNLGKVLKGIDEKPYVSTKVQLDPSNTDDLFGQIEKSLHDSLERLQLDRVDLFQLHNGIESHGSETCLSTMDVLGREGAFDAMEKLRAQGLIRWIGMTALGDTGLCIRLMESGRIDTAQVFYSLVNPTAEHRIPKNSFNQAAPKPSSGQDFTGLLETCEEWNIGVIAVRTMAAGVLASDERHGREVVLTKDTSIEEDTRKATALMALLGDAHGTRPQTALRYALSHPAVSTAAIGVSDLDQLEENLAVPDLGKLPEETLADIRALYESDYGKA